MPDKTSPNTCRLRPPSKVPLPIPLSRFSTTLTSPPSSNRSSLVDKPLPNLPSPSTPSKIPRPSISSSAGLSNTTQTNSSGRNSADGQSKISHSSRPSTRRYSYISGDGSCYGPKLSISKDADRLILGVKRNSTKSRPGMRASQLSSENIHHEKPLPRAPSASPDPQPLKFGHESAEATTERLFSKKDRGRYGRESRNARGNEIAVATYTATKLLDQALTMGPTEQDQQEQERLVTAAKALVEAILSARDAEIRVLKAEEALSVAEVKAHEAKVTRAASQPGPVERAEEFSW